jgi:O-antigen/teichoic acid export membrane protein
MSSDYALYARGFPIVGSVISLFRVVTPLLVAILSINLFPDYLLTSYLLATILVYLVTNIIISIYLKVGFFYLPSFRSIKSYAKTIPLGIINLCFYFFGLGVLLVAQLIFNQEELVISFLALKFYLVYKGAIRVIQQAFVNRMKEEQVCLSIDKICIMMSVLFLGSTIIYTNTFVTLFFGNQFIEYNVFFILLGVSALVYSIFSSATTRVLLERKDVEFMRIAIVSVCLSIVSLLIMVQFFRQVEAIIICLLIGECFFAGAMAIRFFTQEQILQRIYYLMICSIGLVLPYLMKIAFSESLITYLLSFAMTGVIFLLFSYKKLDLPESPMA